MYRDRAEYWWNLSDCRVHRACPLGESNRGVARVVERASLARGRFGADPLVFNGVLVMANQTRSSWLTSPMVAVPPSAPATTNFQSAFSGFERRQVGKAIDKWSPRADPSGRDKWDEQVKEAMRTSVPAVPQLILEGPPTRLQVRARFDSATDEEVESTFSVTMKEYQQMNTWLWDLIDDSVDLSGAYEKVDRATKRSTCIVGDARDGVELRRWALEISRPNSVDKQIEAMRVLSAYPVMKAGGSVTRVELDMHLNGLIEAWTAIDGNDAGSLTKSIDFRTRLLASLPTEPVTVKSCWLGVGFASKLMPIRRQCGLRPNWSQWSASKRKPRQCRQAM